MTARSIGEILPRLIASILARAIQAAGGNEWARLRTAYEVALAAERAYDAEHITPIVPDGLTDAERQAACSKVSDEVWTESQRLQDIRCEAEDRLLDLPSPHFAAFALKVLICRGEGRDLNRRDVMLEAEARDLLAAYDLADPAHAGDVLRDLAA